MLGLKTGFLQMSVGPLYYIFVLYKTMLGRQPLHRKDKDHDGRFLTKDTPQKGLSTKLLAGSILGLGGGLVGLFQGLQTGDKAPFLGWLWGCSFWLSIAIGMLMLIMIFRVFNSRWSPVVRRQQEHALSAFPWLALCFLPLLLVAWFGKDQAGILWSWVNPASPTIEVSSIISVEADVLHQKKAGYLNLNFFTLRLIAYFANFLWD